MQLLLESNARTLFWKESGFNHFPHRQYWDEFDFAQLVPFLPRMPPSPLFFFCAIAAARWFCRISSWSISTHRQTTDRLPLNSRQRRVYSYSILFGPHIIFSWNSVLQKNSYFAISAGFHNVWTMCGNSVQNARHDFLVKILLHTLLLWNEFGEYTTHCEVVRDGVLNEGGPPVDDFTEATMNFTSLSLWMRNVKQLPSSKVKQMNPN